VKRHRGVICVGAVKDRRIHYLGEASMAPCHLSFPFVFEHEGEVFMLPETHETLRIEVWRCTDFPLRWELAATALEGCSAVDSAIVRHNGAWWLFTNISRGVIGDHRTELELFEIDGPMLNWVRPHPRNPVVIDPRFARNAGRIFKLGDRLVRPSQDNSRDTYGYGLNLMEIGRLDADDYEERPIRQIVGSHHLDVCEGVFVFDGRGDAADDLGMPFADTTQREKRRCDAGIVKQRENTIDAARQP